jgi:Mrp family chromosome partitioning ATPase
MTGNDTATIQQEEAPPKDSNEVCVGPTSAAAGKSASCAGCPNAKLCASGAPAVKDNTPSLVASRLAAVSNKILVLSGKGGVGKSTVANMIANALSVDEGCNIGLLDTDLTGPSIPRMCGALDEQVHASNSGWSPVYVKENLAVMSIGFMLKNNSDAVIWRGPKKNGVLI